MLSASGNPFKCHEEFLYLQPMIPPKRFDSFPLDWGMLRRSRCVQIFILNSVIVAVEIRCIDYTESEENHSSIIFDGVCYPVIHFCRVILPRMMWPSCSLSLLGEYLVIFTSAIVFGRLCTSANSNKSF